MPGRMTEARQNDERLRRPLAIAATLETRQGSRFLPPEDVR
jgi:hypothetical protein